MKRKSTKRMFDGMSFNIGNTRRMIGHDKAAGGDPGRIKRAEQMLAGMVGMRNAQGFIESQKAKEKRAGKAAKRAKSL